ncbi:flagellar hook-associated protein FlgK [Pseudooceanicola sp. CBS1P-1]|uniref:Flagellar hook-associated protein 1 n=1 Tax=Pseudooceanicola albus TaxID=2692189 RepID=A0A6L7GB78_9RHOB|nr:MULTISPECIES: flagellar hook-associated protein FlgK [Pseudooceanicola]MBT9385811.1 flagellar hook-associated protein FlgK [Pseudooceanicola endophyticus]MXN20043.1 flagellar hook-associated protein FlgK [Pseudooceanicola albus]
MSLSTALSNALSGLTASSRAAAVVSSNISNAMTEGYGPRQLEVSARTNAGGGVNIDGITRSMDAALVGDARTAMSGLSYQDTLSTYYTRMEDIMGTPEDSYSLTGRIATFESSLVTAASRPDLPERLTDVLYSARDVASGFEEASDTIQSLRMQADSEIAAAVDRTNELLQQVKELNVQITTAINTGSDANALMDLRQSTIDTLSEIIPVTETSRDHGAIALFTPGGAILVDGQAAELGFTRTNMITANMTLDAGLLSGLTINGIEIDTGNASGAIGGGRLAALFEIRDDLAVESQSRLDTVARDMIERFQDSALDTTRASGDAGLFTDEGAVFSAADEVGISARIGINAIVDPAQGGETWHLRDGLGATVIGSVGDASLLQDMVAAMQEARVPSSSAFGSSGLSASALAASLQSFAGTEANAADNRLAFAQARQSEVKERLLADGVDTDAEMQRLLVIEQNYAANARIVQVVDEMLQILMEI